MKSKFIKAYMDVAQRFSELSSAKRLQVGAIVVKDDRIISIGYNGMPSGWDNNCEDELKFFNFVALSVWVDHELIAADKASATGIQILCPKGARADDTTDKRIMLHALIFTK